MAEVSAFNFSGSVILTALAEIISVLIKRNLLSWQSKTSKLTCSIVVDIFQYKSLQFYIALLKLTVLRESAGAKQTRLSRDDYGLVTALRA